MCDFYNTFGSIVVTYCKLLIMENLFYYFGAGVLGLIIGYNLKKYNNHKINFIIKTLKEMAKSQAETAQELRDIHAQNEKARVEILAKIQALEDALVTAGNTSEEVDAAVQDLKASVQTDDDIVPDAPPAS